MQSAPDLFPLPPDLPVPVDDGACDHLAGMTLPSVPLRATDGSVVDLAALPGLTVVYCYPRTGNPTIGVPPEWDAIPGARGCTPQSLAFKAHYYELQELGARIFGLSTQTTEYQQEVANRLDLPFPLLSDVDLAFVRALRLPTFEFDDQTMVKRLTLVVRDGRIEHVFYPVFPPDANAGQVIAYLRERG